MVNDAKVDIEAEKRERMQSEETMLQLLESTCSQIAAQRAKENAQNEQLYLQKLAIGNKPQTFNNTSSFGPSNVITPAAGHSLA